MEALRKCCVLESDGEQAILAFDQLNSEVRCCRHEVSRAPREVVTSVLESEKLTASYQQGLEEFITLTLERQDSCELEFAKRKRQAKQSASPCKAVAGDLGVPLDDRDDDDDADFSDDMVPDADEYSFPPPSGDDVSEPPRHMEVPAGVPALIRPAAARAVELNLHSDMEDDMPQNCSEGSDNPDEETDMEKTLKCGPAFPARPDEHQEEQKSLQPNLSRARSVAGFQSETSRALDDDKVLTAELSEEGHDFREASSRDGEVNVMMHQVPDECVALGAQQVPDECIVVLGAKEETGPATDRMPLETVLDYIATRGDYCPSSTREGQARLPNGSVYTGQWLGVMRHGNGKMSNPDTGSYQGEFVANRAHGWGKLQRLNGSVYDGNFFEDKAHGHGIVKHQDGSSYVGEWLSDRKHGQGKECWADGSQYMGDYAEGRKHGSGVFASPDSSRYAGQFFSDHFHGVGKYVFSDGRVYVGEWQQSLMHGKGKMLYPDGRCYEGAYVKNRRAGEGKLIWSDGSSYDGQWKDGKQHGVGEYLNPHTQGHRGVWCSGRFERYMIEAEV